MYLTEENRDEAITVLKYLEVENCEDVFCDNIFWKLFRPDGLTTLGGRDGWSGLCIDRGPDYEEDTDLEYDEVITINGVSYAIHEDD